MLSVRGNAPHRLGSEAVGDGEDETPVERLRCLFADAPVRTHHVKCVGIAGVYHCCEAMLAFRFLTDCAKAILCQPDFGDA